METQKNTDIQNTIAKIVSIVFHPLFIPLYGLLIIFTAPTLFWYLPLKMKKIIFLIVVINNVFIPLSLMPFFRFRNIISTWTVDNRKERIVPLLAVSLLYSITSFLMFKFQIPLFLKAFIFSISFLTLTVTVINFWWKISLHSVGAGALTGIVIILSLKMGVPLFWYLIPVILIAGMVLSSRLKLNTHDTTQVYLGFLTGLAGMSFFMLFF